MSRTIIAGVIGPVRLQSEESNQPKDAPLPYTKNSLHSDAVDNLYAIGSAAKQNPKTATRRRIDLIFDLSGSQAFSVL